MTRFSGLSFSDIPAMLPILGTTRDVELLGSLTVTWKGGEFTVPRGFRTDGPSTPNRLRGIVYYTHAQLRPSIAHDFLYVTQPKDWTRERADELFLQGLKVEGVGWLRRKAMWSAVRTGGGWWKD